MGGEWMQGIHYLFDIFYKGFHALSDSMERILKKINIVVVKCPGSHVIFNLKIKLTSTHSPRRLCKLKQFGVDDLVGFSQHTDQIISLLLIIGGEECVGGTGALTTSSTPDAMHVVF